MKGSVSDGSYSPDYSLAAVDLKSFKNNLMDIIQQNKERWKELAAQGQGTQLWAPGGCSSALDSLPLDLFVCLFFFLKIHTLLVLLGIWLPFDYP